MTEVATEVVTIMVTMILCMLCGSTNHADGYTITLMWPTVHACEDAADKIDRTFPSAVPICLLDPQYIQAEMFLAADAIDDVIREGLAREVCQDLGGLRKYPDMAVCLYHFGGPGYRAIHDEPPGYIPMINPGD